MKSQYGLSELMDEFFGSFRGAFRDGMCNYFHPFSEFKTSIVRKNTVQSNSFPTTTISTINNETVIEIELPGWIRDDVVVEITDHRLTISGDKKGSKFTRSISFRRKLTADKIEANYNEGLLTIRIQNPVVVKQKPTRIQIK